MSVEDFLDEFIKHQIASCDTSVKPDVWLSRFIQSSYTPISEQSTVPFVSNPFSIESVVLWAAARGEIARDRQISSDIGDEIVKRAESDRHTDDLARTLVLNAITEGFILPESMLRFAKRVVFAQPRTGSRGDRGWKLHNRDRIGAMAMLVLTSPNGFAINPTRNPTATNPSACDLLSKATEGMGWASISPSVADEIWRNRKRLWEEFALSWQIAVARNNGSFLKTESALTWLSTLDALGSGRKTKN